MRLAEYQFAQKEIAVNHKKSCRDNREIRQTVDKNACLPPCRRGPQAYKQPFGSASRFSNPPEEGRAVDIHDAIQDMRKGSTGEIFV